MDIIDNPCPNETNQEPKLKVILEINITKLQDHKLIGVCREPYDSVTQSSSSMEEDLDSRSQLKPKLLSIVERNITKLQDHK